MVSNTEQILQNRYRILIPLGQGGMGTVYRAWDIRLNVAVALKEMLFQSESNPHLLAQLRQQFQQEAQILARLKHPHLVRVSDFFEEGGKAYLVMDFIEGESLAQRIAREGALSEASIIEWASQLLDALEYCHQRGVIHRDIKPHNIIICPNNQAVLVDFGLVKLWNPNNPLTRTAMRGMGTPEYAPPEQYDVSAGHTDSRSDIYSMGATLYHALTGQAPPTATQRMVNPLALKPPKALNPHISTRTEQAVLKALEPQPEQRFQTAYAMAAALSGKFPIASSSIAFPNQRTKIMPRNILGKQSSRVLPHWIWGVGILGVLLLIGMPWVLSSGKRKAQEVATPTAVPTAATATSTSIPTWTTTAIPIVTPSATPTNKPTQTPLSTDIPTQTPRPTSTPTPIPTPTSAATFTPTPKPPPTEKPTSTFTPPPPVACAPPSLIAPPDGALFDTWEKPDLQWSYNCTLGLYDHYDVRVWRDGNLHYGVNWTKDPVFRLDCQAWYDDYGAGRFCWSIAIVRGQNGVLEEVLVGEGATRCVEIHQGVRPSPTPSP